jgi:hypothetical protein
MTGRSPYDTGGGRSRRERKRSALGRLRFGADCNNPVDRSGRVARALRLSSSPYRMAVRWRLQRSYPPLTARFCTRSARLCTTFAGRLRAAQPTRVRFAGRGTGPTTKEPSTLGRYGLSPPPPDRAISVAHQHHVAAVSGPRAPRDHHKPHFIDETARVGPAGHWNSNGVNFRRMRTSRDCFSSRRWRRDGRGPTMPVARSARAGASESNPENQEGNRSVMNRQRATCLRPVAFGRPSAPVDSAR